MIQRKIQRRTGGEQHRFYPIALRQLLFLLRKQQVLFWTALWHCTTSVWYFFRSAPGRRAIFRQPASQKPPEYCIPAPSGTGTLFHKPAGKLPAFDFIHVARFKGLEHRALLVNPVKIAAILCDAHAGNLHQQIHQKHHILTDAQVFPETDLPNRTAAV